jgi:hypothetical protein
MVYLLLAFYLGLIFDVIIFSGSALIDFVGLTVVICLYFILRLVFSKHLKKLSRLLFV